MVCCGSGSPWPVVRVSIAAWTWNSNRCCSSPGGGKADPARSSELLCQPAPDLGILDPAGDPAQVEGVLVVVEGKRVHRIAPVAVEVSLLWRGDDEGIQPGEQRAHRMQSWPAVGPHRAQEGQADAVWYSSSAPCRARSGCRALKSLHEITASEPGKWGRHLSTAADQDAPSAAEVRRIGRRPSEP